MQKSGGPGRRPQRPVRDTKKEYASPSGKKGRPAGARPGAPENRKNIPQAALKNPQSAPVRRPADQAGRRPRPDPRRAEAERRKSRLEAERLRYEKELKRMKAQRKKENREKRKVFYSKAVICLIFFAVLASLLAVILSVGFFSSSDKTAGKTVTYKFGGKEICTAPSDTVVSGKTVFVDFSDLADYLGLSRVGSTENMKYIFTSHNDAYVSLSTSSRYALVNGYSVLLDEVPVSYRKSIWVPVSFIESSISGLSAEYKDSTVSISRIVDESKSDESSISFVDVYPIPETALALVYGEEEDSGTLNFKNDLSEYGKYMDPDKPEEYLKLVGRENTLDASAVPGDLVNVEKTRQDGRETQKLRITAAKALEAMFLEMESSNIYDMSVTSGYRSYEEESEVFDSYVDYEMAMNPYLSEEEAREKAHEETPLPGESEHQTGLALDMHNMESADEKFAETDAFRWMRKNAWKFGFILRYPEGKEDITGVGFEPWHWRFVGRTNAKKIYDGALTLEEFVSSNIEN